MKMTQKISVLLMDLDLCFPIEERRRTHRLTSTLLEVW